MTEEVKIRKYSAHETIQIYTDWANHYLDKAKCKKQISDLQNDVCDSLLLIDVIEAVTNQKIRDVTRKPKTTSQMTENIQNCLSYLGSIGVILDGITAKDIREGNLKSILGLFFALSRHKQQTKQRQQQLQQQQHLVQQSIQPQYSAPPHKQGIDSMLTSRLPSPFTKNGTSSIPTPNLGQRRPQPAGGLVSTNSSRSTSPVPHSQLPTLRPLQGGRLSLNEKNGSLRSKELNGTKSVSNRSPGLKVPCNTISGTPQPPSAKSTMLDKFKLFQGKDISKQDKGKGVISKRTSSSSGFSSAKSERSDSSNSLCSDNKPSLPDSPKTGLKGLRTKVNRSSSAKSRSPKVSKKEQGLKDPDKLTPALEVDSQVRHSKIASLHPKSGPVLDKKVADESCDPIVSSTGIPKPTAAVKGTSKVCRDTNTLTKINKMATTEARSPSEPRSPTVTLPRHKMGRDGGPSVALVTPMPSQPLQQIDLMEGDKKSPAVEPHMDEEGEDGMVDVTPMKPLLRTSHYGYMRGLGLNPRGSSYFPIPKSGGAYTVSRHFGEALKNSHEYVEIDAVETNGYMSDGEVLKAAASCEQYDGYISEGGCNIYARKTAGRINQFPNGSFSTDDRVTVQSVSAVQGVAGHRRPKRLDDTSSLSSGISEIHDLSTDDNMTSSSLASDRSTSMPGWKTSGNYPAMNGGDVQYRVVTGKTFRKMDSSQQTEHSAFSPVASGARIVRSSDALTDPGGGRDKKSPSERKPRSHVEGEKSTRHSASPKPSQGGRKSQSPRVGSPGLSYSKRSSTPTGKTRVKGDSPEPSRMAQAPAMPRDGGESDRPRTKLKVCGSTQTTSDLQNSSPRLHNPVPDYCSGAGGSLGRKQSLKSYSLTPSNAAQLSQNVRERFLASYSKTISGDYSSYLAAHYNNPKCSKVTDGSLSDSTYCNYSDLRACSTYAWGCTRSPTARVPGFMGESESTESLPSSNASSSVAAQIQHARASGLSQTRHYMNQREVSPKLNRSSSISQIRTFPRSTKSEKVYPSMLQRSEDYEHDYMTAMCAATPPHHTSQPTSPTLGSSPAHFGKLQYTLSTIAAATSGSPNRSRSQLRDDEAHGSTLSLVSTSSSIYSTQEEKQAQQIRKLRKDLSEAQEKVSSLTNQLSTNAHVVAAFEQSLANMTNRLQQLTATAEQKDSELSDLRRTIDLLRQQGVAAGLVTELDPNSTCQGQMSRQLSTDSVSSLSSACSAASHTSAASHSNSNDSPGMQKKKKKGWLRSSFSKAFSRSKKNRQGSVSDVEDSPTRCMGDLSAPGSPLLTSPRAQNEDLVFDTGDIHDNMDRLDEPELVLELKKQLREKDMALTDIRLEALTSAHQLESLKETVNKMRSEMFSLKQDNDRLQRLVNSKSLALSQSSLPHSDCNDRRYSLSDGGYHTEANDTNTDILPEGCERDGKLVTISVFLGCHGDPQYYARKNRSGECIVGAICVSGKTKWDILDELVNKVIKDYLQRVDPVSSLGLALESVNSYHLGEVTRSPCTQLPELLPCGYLVGDIQSIQISFKGTKQNRIDALVFETLVPKSILHRYISLLTEHRRIILCGPSGTGKSYLAQKLAEYMVWANGKIPSSQLIATFSVEHKSGKELRQYLSHISDQCQQGNNDLPDVIILDNLHHVGSLADVFNGFLTCADQGSWPIIIGTMNQATCSTTNLQLHHNFRWILCANHVEPVRGFLSRYLRRKLVEKEVQIGSRNMALGKIMDWIPRVWHHLNKFIETHTSSDVTIGPRLFLSCPTIVEGSQVWFTDLWNYSVVPYLLEATREGLQLYGRRANWEDPAEWVLETYPWTCDAPHAQLLRLRPEDVGYDVQSPHPQTAVPEIPITGDKESDPLLNMLLRLQEAANYSIPHSNDPDGSEVTSGQGASN